MNLGTFKERLKEAKEEKTLPKRAGIVKLFVDKINSEREGTEYPPVKGQRMAIKLSKQRTGMSDGDLFAFFHECSYQRNFGAYFFSRFKK